MLGDMTVLYLTCKPLKTKNSQMGTLSKCEDLDEIPNNTAFHQGLHC